MWSFTKRTVPAQPRPAPPSVRPIEGSGEVQKATFAAGCFWGVEAAFREVEGVVETRVGYTGGRTADPTYDRVCSHTTGHAEAVEVSFDPRRVSYEQLLATFWRIHDPTTRNRQGWDVGDQYRSAIFVHDAEQAAAATTSLEHEQPRVRRPIVTEVTPAGEFYPAEEYHQRYLEKHGRVSCATTLRAQPSSR